MQFQYTARDPKGQSASGQVAAETEGEAIGLLREQGLFPTDVRPTSEPEEDPGKGKVSKQGAGLRIAASVVIWWLFCRAVMHIPLDGSLGTLQMLLGMSALVLTCWAIWGCIGARWRPNRFIVFFWLLPILIGGSRMAFGVAVGAGYSLDGVVLFFALAVFWLVVLSIPVFFRMLQRRIDSIEPRRFDSEEAREAYLDELDRRGRAYEEMRMRQDGHR